MRLSSSDSVLLACATTVQDPFFSTFSMVRVFVDSLPTKWSVAVASQVGTGLRDAAVIISGECCGKPGRLNWRKRMIRERACRVQLVVGIFHEQSIQANILTSSRDRMPVM